MRKLTFEEITEQRVSAEAMREVNRFPVYVVAENIRSMYNVGAMFRTSDAACIQELLLCGYTACPPRKEIEKTALGATDTVPWRHFPTGVAAVKYLKEQGVYIIALEHCEESQDIMEMEFPFPAALVVGNEVEGVTTETLNWCNAAAEIPMFGMKQSLNAAVAYGIAVFRMIDYYRKHNERKVAYAER